MKAQRTYLGAAQQAWSRGRCGRNSGRATRGAWRTARETLSSLYHDYFAARWRPALGAKTKKGAEGAIAGNCFSAITQTSSMRCNTRNALGDWKCAGLGVGAKQCPAQRQLREQRVEIHLGARCNCLVEKPSARAQLLHSPERDLHCGTVHRMHVPILQGLSGSCARSSASCGRLLTACFSSHRLLLFRLLSQPARSWIGEECQPARLAANGAANLLEVT